ncbi:MAG TPA: hypothetical protein DEP04_08060 [Dehalococcoidia bacterium]|nr:hypothetical protein [Pseudomonadales bacterium]HBO93618.1 hypothetical protein [Gammaproteobacteria bacterium]HCE76569.1 hypothetical protein [Dehalococcoidia bacterium]
MTKFNHLLTNTSSLMNQIYWFQQYVKKPAAASHRTVSIKYVDIKEKRDEFIRELKSTAISWVYSQAKFKELLDSELLKRGDDFLNATSYIHEIAQQKFRHGCPQGQFGELLLFNFIQHFFSAPPLLRKMPITTNPGLERNGADAIHYREDEDCQIFILGESKCYESKYSFNSALKASVKSIIESFENIENELVLYRYDDFIDAQLKDIAHKLKDGSLSNPRFELVCLIAYEENKSIDAPTAEDIQKNLEQCIKERWNNSPNDLYHGVRAPLIERIHYVIFPSWNLNDLLDRF